MGDGPDEGLHTKCDQCIKSGSGVCGAAGAELRQELNRISHLRYFSAGETVLAENENAGIVGNVIGGVLRLVKVMPDGRQQIVGMLFPCEMFGRVFSPTERFAIEAATDVSLCCYDRKAFERLLARNHELEHHLLVSVLDELDAARDWMLLLGCQNIIARIAGFLLMLAHRNPVPGASRKDAAVSRISVPVKRRDLALYLGTTVESISRTIQYLRRKGIIRIVDSRHFEILEESRLAEIAGQSGKGSWTSGRGAKVTSNQITDSANPANPMNTSPK